MELERVVGHFVRKFPREWGSSTNDCWLQKTRVTGGLSRGVVCVILRLAVLIQYRRVTDRQTDTDSHRDTRRRL